MGLAATLNEPELAAFTIVGSYDPGLLELLPGEQYSDLFDRFAFLANFYSFPSQSVFLLAGTIYRDAIQRFLNAAQPSTSDSRESLATWLRFVSRMARLSA